MIVLVRRGQPNCPPLEQLRANTALSGTTLSVGIDFSGIVALTGRDWDYDDTYESAWEIIDLLHQQTRLRRPDISQIQKAFGGLEYELRKYKKAKKKSVWKALGSFFWHLSG
jgi:hypothetical protein